MKINKISMISIIKIDIKKALFKHKSLIGELDVNIQKAEPEVEKTKDLKFGDYSSNFAMSIGLKREDVQRVARAIASSMSKKRYQRVEVVGPGFLNITLKHKFNANVLKQVIFQKADYGKYKSKKKFYNIELVSANPTGFLHIGHARNAAIGDTLARIWEAYGISVNREYYINDAGNQINKLALSVLIRYKQELNQEIVLPEDAYHGQEIIEVAKILVEKYADKYIGATFNDDKITDVECNKVFADFAKKFMLEQIALTLEIFNVNIDIWFSESNIYKNNLISKTINNLKKYIYVQDDASWLKTTKFGDDKDRVLIKKGGEYTYFAPDIAYHDIKMSREYDELFNIWGSDHASYAARMKIAMKMLGYNPDKLTILIMQMVRLTKDGEDFKMSKRTGNSLTLIDLINAIGKDAARWHLVSQQMSSHLEIDVDKATSKTNDNPIYYVQYAHARINQLLEKKEYRPSWKFDLLISPIERELINAIHYFKHTIENISKNYEVNKMTLYLTNLAKVYHSYYANNKIIDDTNEELSIQRYWLSFVVKQIIANGLTLLGITPLEKM